MAIYEHTNKHAPSSQLTFVTLRHIEILSLLPRADCAHIVNVVAFELIKMYAHFWQQR